MSIYTYLKKDHNKMSSLMKRIEALGDEETDKRTKLFNELKEMIVVHAEAEEQVFYKPLAMYRKTEDEVEHGIEEHEEAEQLLEELTDPSLVGAAWAQKFKKLRREIEHHNKEEEKEIFPKAKELLDKNDAHVLEVRMRDRKEMIKRDEETEDRPTVG